MPWLLGSQVAGAALATATSVCDASVETSPEPLSPLQIELFDPSAQSAIASSYGSTVFEKPPQSPWSSTVAVSSFSEPFDEPDDDSRPKPASSTLAPVGNGPPAVGSGACWTAGPLRSSGWLSASTATSSGDAVGE